MKTVVPIVTYDINPAYHVFKRLYCFNIWFTAWLTFLQEDNKNLLLQETLLQETENKLNQKQYFGPIF